MAFTIEEVDVYLQEAERLMNLEVLTGVNFYERSVESEFERSITIPAKYGHREEYFLEELASRIKGQFDFVNTERYPREVIYKWPKVFNLPRKGSGIRIRDVKAGKFLKNKDEYKKASDNLLAYGQEYSLVVRVNDESQVPEILKEVFRLGSYFKLGRDGCPLEVGSRLIENSEDRISVDANKIPMVVIPSTPTFRKLEGFNSVKKVLKISGDQELSFYIASLYRQLKKKARLNMLGKVKTRLANKLFIDFLDNKIDPRLREGREPIF